MSTVLQSDVISSLSKDEIIRDFAQSERKAQAARPVGGWTKRTVDVTIAVCALVALAPIMLMVAAAIYFTMGGPVVFAHKRIGFNRRVFKCYKFRTMVTNAEEKLALHLATDPEAARMWQESQKLINDPRVTWLGRILRKSSLDELPQLFNVLLGDMSCVGPRPVVAAELQRYGQSVNSYLRARPGVAGIWQVSGRSRRSYAERVAMDRYYVRHWSLGMDIKLLAKIIPAVLRFDEAA
jgi:exopolysaccharide production protein ExoY